MANYWGIKYCCNSPKGGFIDMRSLSYTRQDAWKHAQEQWDNDSAALRRQRRAGSTRAVRVALVETASPEPTRKDV